MRSQELRTAMPKKGGKGKKKKEDEWGSIPRETFTTVAVRNSKWHHMQFDLVLPTSTRFGAVVEEIVARHELGGAAECKFMLGAPSGDADADANATLPPSAFDMSLAQLQFPAGSKNDGIKAIVTYDYAPHAHFLNLPQRTAPPVVPPLPRSAAQNEAAWAAAAAARAPQAAAA